MLQEIESSGLCWAISGSGGTNVSLSYLCLTKRGSQESIPQTENIDPKVICWLTCLKWLAASVLKVY